MSWTDQATGVNAYGIRESYHRLLIKLSYSEVLAILEDPSQLKQYQALCQNWFYHFLFVFTEEEIEKVDAKTDVLPTLQKFVALRYLEEEIQITGEVSPTEEFLSKTIIPQRYMYSIQVPLHSHLTERLITFLSIIGGSSLTRSPSRAIYITYVIFQLLHNNDNTYQSSSSSNITTTNKAKHHVFELLSTTAASVSDYDRIDDYQNIQEILHLLTLIQQQTTTTRPPPLPPIYWGIAPNHLPQEHDYLDYFLLLYQQFTGQQFGSHHYHHNRPPPATTTTTTTTSAAAQSFYQPMIYNQTDQNIDHGKDPEIYGSSPTLLSLRLHAILLVLSSTQLFQFRVETIELIHSFGLNTMVEIPAESDYFSPYRRPSPAASVSSLFVTEEEETAAITTKREVFLIPPRIQEKLQHCYLLSQKYKIDMETFLCKFLLQLGNSLIFSWTTTTATTTASFTTAIARLCHPFSYRKEYVSSVKIYSLTIDIEDMEEMIEASREEELEESNQPRSVLYLQPPIKKDWKIQECRD